MYIAVMLALAILGLVLPWYYNVAFFAGGGGIAPSVFFGAAFANPLTTAITIDVYIAALAFSVAVLRERALGRRRWLYVVACFGIGLAFALPLALADRARSKR